MPQACMASTISGHTWAWRRSYSSSVPGTSWMENRECCIGLATSVARWAGGATLRPLALQARTRLVPARTASILARMHTGLSRERAT